jgi:hypothetical protein
MNTLHRVPFGSSGLAGLTMLSLSALVMLTPRESRAQETRAPERPVTQPASGGRATTHASPTQTTAPASAAPSVATALETLRATVLAEVVKVPAMQDLGVAEPEVVITSIGANNLIAGVAVPMSGAAAATGPQSQTVGPEGAAAIPVARDPRVVGVVFMVGSFPRPIDARGGVIESAFEGELQGGTFLVRRETPGSREVQIVDSRDQTIATVPVLEPVQAISATPSGAVEATPAAVVSPTDAPADWSRIYMSIVHYFHPELG